MLFFYTSQDALMEAWNDILTTYTQTLYRSVRFRLASVIEKKKFSVLLVLHDLYTFDVLLLFRK